MIYSSFALYHGLDFFFRLSHGSVTETVWFAPRYWYHAWRTVPNLGTRACGMVSWNMGLDVRSTGIGGLEVVNGCGFIQLCAAMNLEVIGRRVLQRRGGERSRFHIVQDLSGGE